MTPTRRPPVRSQDRSTRSPSSPVLAVVSTYDEAENVDDVIDRVLGLETSGKPAGVRADVLVVDDASPDGTGERVRSHPCFGDRVFLHRRAGRLGLGSAYRDGFVWGQEAGYAVLVQLDADGSHPVERIPALVACLRNHDLAVGSRYVSGGSTPGWPLARRLLSRAANRYARGLLWLPMRDTTSGFRAWRDSALLRAGVEETVSEGYCFQIETSWRAVRAGLSVTELPIAFTDRTRGESTMGRRIALEAARRVVAWRLHEVVVRTGLGRTGPRPSGRSVSASTNVETAAPGRRSPNGRARGT